MSHSAEGNSNTLPKSQPNSTNRTPSKTCIAYLLCDKEKKSNVFQVQDDSMIHYLWDLGAFGIGSLSRTKPTWWLRTLERQYPTTSNKKSNYVENLSQLRKLSRLNPGTQAQYSSLILNQWNQLHFTQTLVPTLEVLNLLPEEAFYLMSENQLQIYMDNDNKTISLENLLQQWDEHWELFARAIAYYFFRKAKWIPKSGMKFGVDWVLYRNSPQHVHSKYAVILHNLEPEAFDLPLLPLPSFKAGPAAWLKTVERVVSHAKKTLVLCYVVVPKDLSKRKVGDFMKNLENRCYCVQLKRWNPEAHR